jgi:hypothetical protein
MSLPRQARDKHERKRNEFERFGRLFIHLLSDLFIAHAGGLKDAFDRAIGARAAHIRAEGTSNNIPDQ